MASTRYRARRVLVNRAAASCRCARLASRPVGVAPLTLRPLSRAPEAIAPSRDAGCLWLSCGTVWAALPSRPAAADRNPPLRSGPPLTFRPSVRPASDVGPFRSQGAAHPACRGKRAMFSGAEARSWPGKADGGAGVSSPFKKVGRGGRASIRRSPTGSFGSLKQAACLGAALGRGQGHAWLAEECGDRSGLFRAQGSRLVGSYDSVIAFGQSRALVVWRRIILPDGSSIEIDNLPATDAAGYAGLEDEVDFHTWRIVKGRRASQPYSALGQSSPLGMVGVILSARSSNRPSRAPMKPVSVWSRRT